MLVPIVATIDMEHPSEATRQLVPTTLSARAPGWREVVGHLHDGGTTVALILLDQSAASRAIADAIQDRFEDLDRALGDDVAVLTTAAPPIRWLQGASARLRARHPLAAGIAIDDAIYAQTAAGAADSARNMADVLRDHYDGQVSLPAILMFDLGESVDDPGHEALDAVAWPLGAFATADALVGAFEVLAAHARAGRARGASAAEVGAAAWSRTNPASLHWRGAPAKVAEQIDKLLAWVRRIKV